MPERMTTPMFYNDTGSQTDSYIIHGYQYQHSTMIIDFNCQCKDYSTKIAARKDSDGWDYSCPNCGKVGQFEYFATYFRHLITVEDFDLIDMCMEIHRIKCLSRNTTHGILPMEAVPFFQFGIPAIFMLVQLIADESARKTTKSADANGISPQLLYRYLLIVRNHMDELTCLFRSMGLWKSPEDPSLTELITIARSGDPPFPQEEYYRKYQKPIFLNRRSTGKYTFRTGAAYLPEALYS